MSTGGRVDRLPLGRLPARACTRLVHRRTTIAILASTRGRLHSPYLFSRARRGHVAAKGLSITSDGAVDVKAPVELEHVDLIDNHLLDNALTYAPPGGETGRACPETTRALWYRLRTRELDSTRLSPISFSIGSFGGPRLKKRPPAGGWASRSCKLSLAATGKWSRPTATDRPRGARSKFDCPPDNPRSIQQLRFVSPSLAPGTDPRLPVRGRSNLGGLFALRSVVIQNGGQSRELVALRVLNV